MSQASRAYGALLERGRGEKLEDLYWRLHSLSKSLESSGRIDEHEQPEAYATILDAMAIVQENRVAAIGES